MPAKCIFCGGSPTTNEHIIPEWMSKVLREDPRGALPHKIPYHGGRLSGTGELMREYDTESAVISVTANAFCGPCNHGWMEKIESAARPFLTDMVLGKSVTLGRNARRSVATWLALKALAATYTGLVPVEREWIDFIYRRRLPPGTWHIWLAGYDGKVVHYMETHDVVNRHFMRASHRAHGVLMTCIVGYLAFQVLGVYKSPTLEPDPIFATRIWPRLPTPQPVNWPPVRVFGDQSIAGFFERYNYVFNINVPSGIRGFLNL